MSARCLRFWPLLPLAMIGFMLVAAPSPNPEDAELTALEVAVVGQQVLVSFELRGAYDTSTAQSIDSGLPTGFTYELRLVRRRKLWFDKTVLSSSVQLVAMYNALTREYLINTKHDGNLVGSRVVRDPAELETTMTRLDRFPAFSLDPGALAGIASDRQLVVRARAELG
ncbi:MAG: DUF4390 domain-containing protein, partial [Thermoanaerobaculia bacterium]|nr:DUF4390 domain-containing protein [Thermoanaerobaculia bacterium]